MIGRDQYSTSAMILQRADVDAYAQELRYRMGAMGVAVNALSDAVEQANKPPPIQDHNLQGKPPRQWWLRLFW